MVSRIKGKGGYSYRQKDTQVREEEIEIGERMMLVSDRMRKEVIVLVESIDSRRDMSCEELRDVIKKGQKGVVEAVEETMTDISDTLAKERQERKEEECIVILIFYTAANVHSIAKQILRITHTSLAHRNFFMRSQVRGTNRLKCLC